MPAQNNLSSPSREPNTLITSGQFFVGNGGVGIQASDNSERINVEGYSAVYILVDTINQAGGGGIVFGIIGELNQNLLYLIHSNNIVLSGNTYNVWLGQSNEANTATIQAWNVNPIGSTLITASNPLANDFYTQTHFGTPAGTGAITRIVQGLPRAIYLQANNNNTGNRTMTLTYRIYGANG